ncbi:hypothetical protein SDC9_200594 [bioreactor metagenome]|uniref:Uncharacterized protein n=1 Tax=bioreactor metagenome TaxID=1076179 RepID=A0A645INN5_9ZZZZ
MSFPKYDEIYKEILESVSDGKSRNIEAIRAMVTKQKNATDENCAVLVKTKI